MSGRAAILRVCSVPLVDLINVPKNANDWEIFAFSNRDQIQAIQQAILIQKNINLTQYELYPINFDNFQEWLQRNEQSHEDINSVLGLQSSDIESVDPKDERQLEAWIYLQYQELYSASAALQI